MVLYLVIFAFLLPCTDTFGQQKKGYSEWIEASKDDIRMLPMYGHRIKSYEQMQADENLINNILEHGMPKKASSEHLIKLGFSYVNEGKLQIAMFRFNQAWLLDSANANVFWGYGAVYFYLRAFDEALRMYKLGLKLDSLNTNIITDVGAVFLSLYDNDTTKKENLKNAIYNLEKSYRINPKYSSTVYKLIICYEYSGNCEKAEKYFKECKKLNKNPMTNEFRKNFRKKCN